MAVRRQLGEVLHDPEPSSIVVVEQPSSPAAVPRVQVLPPSSPQAAEPVSLPEPCAVFQCRGCWTVLGDSLHLCAQEEQLLGILICFRVTNDVISKDSLMIGLEGALLGCAYNTLACRLCGLIVGFILYSAPRDLAYLRGLFCFFKDSILCYLLKSHIVVEASKLKEKLVETHTRMESLIEKLEKLEKKTNGQKSRALHQMQLGYCEDMQ
ncbi:protein Mis18-beta isoform X2 [Strigops habroptila]|uniref:protein Mis18-beta isoform X2 n=1 Tax=Strigops habroptila TaxID=2489341 RepID=UPI0011CED657|nr:protein Mis18-beta isoform X2 [Strigops habroptila]